jgi:hypothetical protein
VQQVFIKTCEAKDKLRRDRPTSSLKENCRSAVESREKLHRLASG